MTRTVFFQLKLNKQMEIEFMGQDERFEVKKYLPSFPPWTGLFRLHIKWLLEHQTKEKLNV